MKDCSVPWCLTHNQASKNCQEMFDHIEPIPPTWTQQPTPTPSITVGTQVRLTGVVGDEDGERERIRVEFGEDAEDEWAWIPCKAKCLEVIRQPFKRGEVVWSCGAVATGIAYQVLADEAPSGDVLLIKESNEGGNRSFVAHYSDFERRP